MEQTPTHKILSVKEIKEMKRHTYTANVRQLCDTALRFAEIVKAGKDIRRYHTNLNTVAEREALDRFWDLIDALPAGTLDGLEE